MGAISVFDCSGETSAKLSHAPFEKERALQNVIEKNLAAMLAIRFLASEHVIENGRIDTLGLDENNVPVIIECKRNRNDGIISQALFYLNWLSSHKADFQLLAQKKLGNEIADQIEWGSPRIICIAESYSPYDSNAINQIKRDIQLVQYHWLNGKYLVLESLNEGVNPFKSMSIESVLVDTSKIINLPNSSFNIDSLDQSEQNIKEAFVELDGRILQLGGDVNKKPLKVYTAYRKIKNFASIVINKKSLDLYLKIDPKSVEIVEGFSRDVTLIGHLASGNLEITLKTLEDVERAMPLIARSYDENL